MSTHSCWYQFKFQKQPSFFIFSNPHVPLLHLQFKLKPSHHHAEYDSTILSRTVYEKQMQFPPFSSAISSSPKFDSIHKKRYYFKLSFKYCLFGLAFFRHFSLFQTKHLNQNFLHSPFWRSINNAWWMKWFCLNCVLSLLIRLTLWQSWSGKWRKQKPQLVWSSIVKHESTNLVSMLELKESFGNTKMLKALKNKSFSKNISL